MYIYLHTCTSIHMYAYILLSVHLLMLICRLITLCHYCLIGSPGEERSRQDKLEDEVKVLAAITKAEGARMKHIYARVEQLEQQMQALTSQVS